MARNTRKNTVSNGWPNGGKLPPFFYFIVNEHERTTMNLNLPQTLSTEEVAALAKLRPQSIRASICRLGHWMGLRPVKLPNRRLVWSAEDVSRILNGEVAA